MKRNTAKQKQLKIIRKTITLPQELVDYATQQANTTAHAGNFSSFIRALLINQQATLKTA